MQYFNSGLLIRCASNLHAEEGSCSNIASQEALKHGFNLSTHTKSTDTIIYWRSLNPTSQEELIWLARQCMRRSSDMKNSCDWNSRSNFKFTAALMEPEGLAGTFIGMHTDAWRRTFGACKRNATKCSIANDESASRTAKASDGFSSCKVMSILEILGLSLQHVSVIFMTHGRG